MADYRVFHRFPGTEIVIYEASLPHPEIALLAQHYISPGATRARAAWDPNLKRSVNIVAGEQGQEFEEHHGVETQAAPKRPPKISGLGADEPERPRRRIVTGPSSAPTTTIQFDPTKPPPRDPAGRAAYMKEMEAYARDLLKKEEIRGAAIRGWRMRALSAQKERELTGESYGTQEMLSALFKRIPSDQKTWLQSGMLAHGDPYSWLRTSSDPEKVIWTPWVKPECAAWLVVEGSKIGLQFAARATPGSLEAKELVDDVQRYLSGEVRCETKVARKMGIQVSSEVLGIPKNMAVTMSPMELFQRYQNALSTGEDLAHEAYHRVLLHRFFQRRLLVPTARKPIGKEAERRANLLQAHRVFVFNSNGCPVGFNKRFLEANGINIEVLGTKNPLLIYAKNERNEYTIEEWTKWLYDEVLGKDPSACRKVLTSEMIDGLRSLAGLGILG